MSCRTPRPGTMERKTSLGDAAELRLILVGKSRVGKSATGNTILGRGEFESRGGKATTTLTCQRGQGRWQDRKISVVDTPDIFGSENHSEIVQNEIMACVRLSQPGPHALIFVTQVGRFTAEDVTAAKRVQDIFEPESARHAIVLFTYKEDLRGESLQEYVQNSNNHNLRELIEGYGNRYCGFNNKAVGDEWQAQVSELMEMVQRVVLENGGRHYVSWMYELPTVRDQYATERNHASVELGEGSALSGHLVELAHLHDSKGSPPLPTAATDEKAKPGTSRFLLPPPVNLLEMAGNIQRPERRIVLVGKTGNGKSATGNAILGSKAFHAAASPKSVTVCCLKKETLWNSGKIVVVDTPGFFDTKVPAHKTAEEVKKCVELCAPGPHVIVQVIRPGRFSQEEQDVAKLIKEIFSLKAKNYMILLFSRKDDLEDKTLEEFLSEDDSSLQEQVSECGSRILAFDNKAKGKEQETQRAQLMSMIDQLVFMNREAPCYTEDMMKQDEEAYKKKEKRWCSLL